MLNMTFPKLRDGWSLDVVNIIAVLGEHNILATSQEICMSKLCFLPRLMPAPQGLLAQRPKDLPSEDGFEIQHVRGELKRTGLPFFARLVHHDVPATSPFSVWVLGVKARDHEQPFLRQRLISPLNTIAILSSAASLGLMVLAIILGDAAALTGVLLLSLSTPILCLGLYWRQGWSKTKPSIGGSSEEIVIIRTPAHGFIIVRCSVAIARFFYYLDPQVNYLLKGLQVRTLSGVVPGLTLICSIVLFGNATWTMKLSLIITYAVLNLLYWIAVIFSPDWTWHINLDKNPDLQANPDFNMTFTNAIWFVIWEVKKINWARDHVPPTKTWDDWLKEAEKQARVCERPDDWPAMQFLVSYMKKDGTDSHE